MVATSNGNRKTTAVSCYSPNYCSDKIGAVEFYSMLQEVTRPLPKHNVIIIGAGRRGIEGGGGGGGWRGGIQLVSVFMIKRTETVICFWI